MQLIITNATKNMIAVTLLLIPTVSFGGHFLASYVANKIPELKMNPMQYTFKSAGHGHAGSFLILALVCLCLVDIARLPESMRWIIRVGPTLSAILISIGFFLSTPGENPSGPNNLFLLVYASTGILLVSMILLAVGLFRL